MPVVTVSINGRDYRVNCDEGQQDHLAQLADYVDQRVAELVAGAGQLGDSRLLVMVSLLLADELWEARREIEALEGGDESTGGPDAAAVLDAGVVARLDSLAERIEAVAANLKDH